MRTQDQAEKTARSARTLKAAGLTASLLLAATESAAQPIQPCNAVNEPGLKILLDDIVATDPALTTISNTLAGEIEKNLEQLRLEAGLDLRVHPCDARRPQGPGDFPKDAAKGLLSREVLLEVWARVAARKDAAGPYNGTDIGYVLVPVRYYEFGAPRPPGAFVISLRSKPLQTSDDLVRLLNQSGRLGAYAALSSGKVLLKSELLRAKRWDPARTQLCRAVSMLDAIPKPRREDSELAEYAKRLAAEALTGARNDRDYGGTMKALPIGPECLK